MRLYRHGDVNHVYESPAEKLLKVGKARCYKCREIKNTSEFSKDVKVSTGFSRTCKSCHTVRSKRRYLEHPEKYYEYRLKKVFKIDLNTYNAILESQNQKCAICHKAIELEKKQLAVDHDHETGKVRGILCMNCNQGLGQFKDSVEYLKRAIQYLKK